MFLALQLTLATAVLTTVAFRLFALAVVAPVSDALQRALEGLITRGQCEQAAALLSQAPRRWTSRVVAAAQEGEAKDELDAVLLDLFDEAARGLPFVRLSATLASTLGLLGGILMIRAGFGGSSGLLALEAGLAERAALAQALLTMAIGVGTAAFAFAAHAALRRASKRAYEQAQRTAKLIRAEAQSRAH